MNKYTHVGWLGICPVYVQFGNSQIPLVEARHFIFEPLLAISEAWYTVKFTIMGILYEEYEPMWPIVITGELTNGRD